MSLCRIQIKDFQCHEMLRVRFDPKITAIVGPSDVGKSSIIRALRWVATNRPLGDGFIRDGSDTSEVKLWTEESSVLRAKDPANIYRIDKREPLKAFGAEVPGDVFKTLKIDDLNFQGQHDPPFWFSLSAGEVARQLNSIVDLGVIDEVMGKLSKVVRECKTTVDVLASRVENVEAEVESYTYVEQLEKEWELLDKTTKECDKQNTLSSALGKSLSQWEDKKSRLVETSEVVLKGAALEGIISMVEELVDGVDDLAEVIEEWEEGRACLDKEIPELGDDSNRLACDAVEGALYEWGSMIVVWGDLESSRDQAEEELRGAEAEWDEVRKDGCPLCERKFDE